LNNSEVTCIKVNKLLIIKILIHQIENVYYKKTFDHANENRLHTKILPMTNFVYFRI